MQELGEGGKEEPKRRGKERGTIYLTGVEKELLEWAMNGFLPTGPQGLNQDQVKGVCTCLLV